MVPRTITINPAVNGYIVQVGCQTFVFNQTAELLREIDRYLGNPEAVEKEYFQAFPRLSTLGGPANPAPPLNALNEEGYASERVSLTKTNPAGTLLGAEVRRRR